MVENIFPYTAMGTPLSPTRAARVAILVLIFRQCRRVSVTPFEMEKYIVISTPNPFPLVIMAEETADIYRMNKLLEIEHADWVRQLEQAVSPPRGFLFFFYFVPKLYQDLLTFN